MSERHLIAYLLLAALIAAVAYGVVRWRRAAYLRRHPRQFGDR